MIETLANRGNVPKFKITHGFGVYSGNPIMHIFKSRYILTISFRKGLYLKIEALKKGTYTYMVV
mgnify:FL=1